MPSYEILQDTGALGLERVEGSSMAVANFGDGYYTAFLLGLPEGLLKWRLVHKYLPQGGRTYINDQGQALNRLDYFHDFYQRHKVRDLLPFWILDNVDHIYYLARFTDDLTLTQIGQAFYQGGQINLVQARLNGVPSSTADPGSLPNDLQA